MKFLTSQQLFAMVSDPDIVQIFMICTKRLLRDNAGFTLIEMMVALLIFSMLSVAGVLLLRSAVDSNEVTAENLSEMATMQRFVSLMEADLSQAVARSYRDEDGERRPAFSSATGTTEDGFLSFTRGGQSNVNNKSRSSLQRVVYRVRDDAIERLHYEMTDGGEVGPPAKLLDDIAALTIRIRNKRGQWVNEWRTERLGDLPRAMEIRFEQDGRSYRHLFLVGTGYL